MPPAWRSFLLSLLALFPIAVLVFLWDCSFFVGWDGQAVSVAPTPAEDPASFVVRIHEGGQDRQVRQINWGAAVVEQLKLPVSAVALAPIEIPETSPDTSKERFSLSYRVRHGEGTDEATWLEAPTTSPRSMVIAVVVFGLLAAFRNMVVAGSPVALEPVNTRNATAAPAKPSGESGKRSSTGRSRKGPPPGKRRRGRGRR